MCFLTVAVGGAEGRCHGRDGRDMRSERVDLGISWWVSVCMQLERRGLSLHTAVWRCVSLFVSLRHDISQRQRLDKTVKNIVQRVNIVQP